MLWIALPKKASGIETDLDSAAVQQAARQGAYGNWPTRLGYRPSLLLMPRYAQYGMRTADGQVYDVAAVMLAFAASQMGELESGVDGR